MTLCRVGNVDVFHPGNSVTFSLQNWGYQLEIVFNLSWLFLRCLWSNYLPVFFVVTAGTGVIPKNQRHSSVRVEFRKIFIVFENTQNLARSDVWVFSKTINNFRNSTLTDECRWFLGITPITTVATKKTRPKNSNASWRNNQDKWNIILNRNPEGFLSKCHLKGPPGIDFQLISLINLTELAETLNPVWTTNTDQKWIGEHQDHSIAPCLSF